MSGTSSNSGSGGISLVGALGLLFIGLKLGHVIHWSWWWVTLPLWGGAALVGVIFVLAGLLMVVTALVTKNDE